MADADIFSEFDIKFTDDGELPPDVKAESKSTKSKSSSGGRKPSLQQLEKALSAQIKLLGLAVSGYDTFDGSIILEASDEVAEALVELAKVNPRARRMLESLMTAGAYGGVVTVLATKIALPIAVHHRLLPESINDNLAEAYEIPLRDQDETNGET